MRRRRKTNVFSMSFLDCICCGFGAVILLFVIVNARSATIRNEKIMDLRGEVSLMEFEVQKGQKNLVELRNTLDAKIDELVRAEGRSRKLIQELQTIELELADSENTTVATREHINKLHVDLKSLDEEAKRMEAAVDADEEGAKIREFKGVGDRHYLTGLKVGGRRILILVDCSASMLSDTIVEVLRRRNMDEEKQRQSAKWQQTVRTVDWLSTQLPHYSKFQVYGFNETAFALGLGTGGTWLDASDPEALANVIDGLKTRVPEKGTSLLNAFNVIQRLPEPPDNIILLTDGLPTVGQRPSSTSYKISASKRLKLFNAAMRVLPAGIPVNVILYPMEGDPRAASEFWRLAINTRGSYFCPAEDWP